LGKVKEKTMTFLILVVAVLLAHFVDLGRYRSKVDVITWYFNGADALFAKRSIFNNWFGVVLLLVPALTIVAFVDVLFMGWSAQVLYPLLSLAILLYCLGGLTLDPSESTERLLSLSAVKFSVILWFALFGPFGAILMRISAEMVESRRWPNISQAAEVWHDLLMWAPIRLLSLSFALIGNFSEVIRYWADHVMSRPSENMSLLTQTCQSACEKKKGAKASSHVIALLNRALLIWLAALALIIIL
jgi:membrane protein required for beta-lactamase induction